MFRLILGMIIIAAVVLLGDLLAKCIPTSASETPPAESKPRFDCTVLMTMRDIVCVHDNLTGREFLVNGKGGVIEISPKAKP